MNDDYAIVVGINHYPGLSPLEGAVLDADLFAAWLTRPDGGNVPAANVTRLRTSDWHPPWPNRTTAARPTLELFSSALFDLLLDGNNNPKPVVGRRLYLYFAGHGFQDRSGREEAALYTANASPASPEHIAGTRWADCTRTAAPFQELVLIMDCCRDMSLVTQIANPVFGLAPSPAAAQVKKFYAYAAPQGAQARERAMQNAGPVRGIFTYVLMDALARAPADQYGNVPGTAVKNYIHNSFPQVAPGLPDPVIEADPAADIVMLTRAPASSQATTEVRFVITPPAPGGTLTILDNVLRQVVTLPLTNGSAQFSLPPGLYKAVLSAGRETLFQALGERTDVPL